MLVHGDYQHFNVLWCDDRLSGVVDWPNAATGNRGSDVGHCRLNLAVLFDARTAGDYLVMYERAAGVPLDRRADLPRAESEATKLAAGRGPGDRSPGAHGSTTGPRRHRQWHVRRVR